MTQGPIGEAHVLVTPDLSRFPAELKAKLDAAFRAIRDPQITVEPELGDFDEKVKRQTRQTERTTKGNVPVAPDLSRFSAEVRTFLAKFDPKEQVKIAGALDRASFAKVVAEAKAVAKAADPKIEVEVDVDKTRFLRTLLTPHPELFQALRAPLARGLSTPLGLAVAGTLTTVLSTAIPSAISLGLGGGLIALGAFALRGSKLLKTSFKAAGGAISESLRQAAQPLKGPFLQAIESITGALIQLRPQFQGLFKALAPSIKPFVDGITGFVRELLPNLQAAMPGINAAFAQFGARLPGLGKTLGGVFAAISSNLPAITRGIDLFFTFSEVILNVAGAFLTLTQNASGFFDRITNPVAFLKEKLFGVDEGQKAIAASGRDATNRQGEMAIATQKSATALAENVAQAGKLTVKLKELRQSFRDQVATVRESIESYAGLITQSDVTTTQVIRDLRNQVANFRTYSKDVKRLIKEGVSPDAIQELSKKGPEFVHALATGSNRELERYKRLWRERQAEVRGNFAKSMELQLGDLAKKIKQMQAEIDKLKGKTVNIRAQADVTAPKGTLLLIEKGLAARGIRVPGRKAGGRITEGSSPTADDVLIRVSRGETVVPASASARPEFRAWARERRIPGFATGGKPAGDLERFRVGMAHTDDTFRELAIALGRGVLSALKTGLSEHARAASGATSGMRFGGAAMNYIASFIRAAGVPFSVISGLRPGARTRGTGSISLHALGRALDLVGPNMLAIWAAATRIPFRKEVIFSPAPFQIYGSGKHAGPPSNPRTRADHYNHVHVGLFDRGGWLMPGFTLAENRSGRPERVVPAERDILGRLSYGGGTTIQNLIVQPLSGQFRLRDVLTELALQGVH